MKSSIIVKYFPTLSELQRSQFEALEDLYSEWNAKINLISRTDLPHLYERHVLHGLAIAKFVSFRPGTAVLDIGTGGGFPGIPLAILFPDSRFLLCDSIGKKITVVNDIINRLGLTNANGINARAESLPGEFDYVVSRATAPLGDLVKWTERKISKKQQNAIPNGIICLKGGDLKAELAPFRGQTEVVELSTCFQEPFFETKKLVFLTC